MADRDEKEKALIKEIELLRQRVTELEHCEEERKRTEEIFLDLFNATEEAAVLMDREGTILVANKNAARLYGVPMERLPGTSIYDLIPSDRVKSSKGKVKTVLETRKLVRSRGSPSTSGTLPNGSGLRRW
jgi:PAS domain-containing protein